LFLPSWMVRLVGAEFGEAIAITLFIAIMLLNPIWTNSILITNTPIYFNNYAFAGKSYIRTLIDVIKAYQLYLVIS